MQAGHERAHPGRTVLALSVGVGLLLLALVVAVIALPEAARIILLGAFAVEAIGGVVLYLVVRRRHW